MNRLKRHAMMQFAAIIGTSLIGSAIIHILWMLQAGPNIALVIFFPLLFVGTLWAAFHFQQKFESTLDEMERAIERRANLFAGAAFILLTILNANVLMYLCGIAGEIPAVFLGFGLFFKLAVSGTTYFATVMYMLAKLDTESTFDFEGDPS